MITHEIVFLFILRISAGQVFNPPQVREVPTEVILNDCLRKNGIALPPYCSNTQDIFPMVTMPNQSQVNPMINNQQHSNLHSNVHPPTYTPSPNPQQSPDLANAKLSTILKENTNARNQLVQFLEYSGVPPPWDQLLDFETTQHHQLPDPDNMFRKIRNLLLKFDSVKNCIVEALLVIEKYIGRGKAYIVEDLKDLKRYKAILKGILEKLCSNPSAEAKNELFKRFYHIKSKAKEVENSFYKLRDWIVKITKLFKTL